MLEALQHNIFLLKNPVIWALLILASLIYSLLIALLFSAKDQAWLERYEHWKNGLRTFLAALPLLGLLGTISGLMGTFTQMSMEGGFQLQEVVSGGVAEAMLTTQLGLVLVVPGIIVLTYLGHVQNKLDTLNKELN